MKKLIIKNYLKLVQIFGILLLAGFGWAENSIPVQSTDFISLFNNYRQGYPQPIPWAGSFFPYKHNGTGADLDQNGNITGNISTPARDSALLEYQEAFSASGAQDWETSNHTCERITNEDEKSGCKAWWGHCNGWSGAAIKENEPRKPVKIGGRSLSVAAQKGILTEYWLEITSYFEGRTNKSSKTDIWIGDVNDPRYDDFWDVTPRQFFLILTNYLGIQKTGVVIDRFTGDQVWNQPLVGYRFLPITSKPKTKELPNGVTVYRYLMSLKIYWANDGVQPGHVSRAFPISSLSDSAQIESGLFPDYDGRVLNFYLDFDRELTVSNGGTRLASGPRLLGDGLWEDQQRLLDSPTSYSGSTTYDHSHPDFVWIPISGFETGSGYRNPYLKKTDVMQLSSLLESGGGGNVVPPPPPQPPTPPPVEEGLTPPAPDPSGQISKFSVVLRKTDDLANLQVSALIKKLNNFLTHLNLKGSVSDLELTSFAVTFNLKVQSAQSEDSMKALFSKEGFTVVSISKN